MSIGEHIHIPGISSVTTIRPPAAGATVLHQTDGTLALAFDAADEEDYAFAMLPPAPDDDAPEPTHDELRHFTARFCAAVVEVLAGDRGPAQLLHCTTTPVYDDLVRRGHALAQVAGSDQRLQRHRPRIRSIHIASPAPGIAEFSIHVSHGHRSRAVAGRLVWRRGAWLCVALQFG